MYSNTDIIYLAGLIDGIGKINYRVHGKKAKDGKLSTQRWYLYLEIFTCNEEIVILIKEYFPESTSFKLKPISGSRALYPVFRIRLTTVPAIALLLQVRPYLKIQKEIVEYVLHIDNTYGNLSQKVPKDEIDAILAKLALLKEMMKA